VAPKIGRILLETMIAQGIHWSWQTVERIAQHLIGTDLGAMNAPIRRLRSEAVRSDRAIIASFGRP